MAMLGNAWRDRWRLARMVWGGDRELGWVGAGARRGPPLTWCPA